MYDGRDQYEQWRSDQSNLTARQLLIGDVDGDGEKEIVFNDGYVFDARFLTSNGNHPNPLANDSACSIWTKMASSSLLVSFKDYLRVFDVDLRREKSVALNMVSIDTRVMAREYFAQILRLKIT